MIDFGAEIRSVVEPLLEQHFQRLRAELVKGAHEPTWAATAVAAKAVGVTRRALDARRRRGALEAVVRRAGSRWEYDVDALRSLLGGRR